MNIIRKEKLGIVTPLANEEKTIEEFLQRTLSQLNENDRLFCVLDNSSKDSTKKIIEEKSKKDSRIELIWSPENKCVVDAYFKGYKTAFDKGYDWILEIDGGLSHLPEEIPRFIEAMQAGIEFAAGSRFIKNGHYIDLGSRYILSKGGTILSNLMLSTKMKDMTSGFECFNRKTMEHVLKNRTKSKAHFFHTEIKYMMHEFKWKEIPITYKNPSNRVGKSNIVEAIKNLWELRKNR